MKNYLRKVCLFAFITVTSIVISCKKDEKPIQKTKSTTQATIRDYDKIVRYLAITLDVPQDMIKYDQKEENFYVPNTVFRESLNSVQLRYDNANEYKLKERK